MRPVWDDEEWLPAAPLTGRVEADVAVVGLGGSGLAAALEGVRLGLDVVAIDAGPVGGGAAGRNGGFALAGLAEFHHVVTTRIGREQAGAAYRLTLAELDHFEEDLANKFRRTGSLRIAADEAEEADCETHLAALRADGFPAEAYEGPEGRGLLFPSDGVIHPLGRCRALARRAAQAGIRMFENTPAIALESGELRTPHGAVQCNAIIVAVDGGLEELLPELRGRVRTTRLQMLATGPTDEVTLPRPVYRRWGYDYWLQRADGGIALGGCRDRFAEEEWSAPAEPSAPVQRALEQILRETIGVRRAAVTHRWAGRVAFTDDHLPIIEQVRPGLFACGAYSGTGNLVGALAGRAAVELAMTGSSAVASVLAPTDRGKDG